MSLCLFSVKKNSSIVSTMKITTINHKMTVGKLETPVLLTPEIFGDLHDNEVYTLSYDLPAHPASIDWNGALLALAHSEGVSILTPIPSTTPLAKSLPSTFQQEWIFQVTNIPTKSPVTRVRFNSKYIVASHEDYSISVIDHIDGSEIKLGDERGHTSDITALDVSNSGLVVSTADDERLLIWENGAIKQDKRVGMVSLVKFWTDSDLDKVIVVQNDIVKILDWKSGEWLFEIYPFPHSINSKNNIKDVHVINGKIIVIGDGWTKTYDPENLEGGAGYTYPDSEASLSGWLPNTFHISSENGLIGGIAQDRSSFYDLNKLEQVHQFKLTVPSVMIGPGSINSQGIVAFVAGSSLLLVRPWDSYEAVY